jgi:predicted amidophosphoribosyltransferase
MSELKDYLLLRIHYDNHHCSSCWEPSDEWNEYHVLLTQDDVVKTVARAIAFHTARRVEFSLTKCKGTEVDGRRYLLVDLTIPDMGSKRWCQGEELKVDVDAAQASQYYIDAVAERMKKDAEAKEKAKEDAVRAAKADERRKQKQDLELLAKLKEKYGDGVEK